MSCQLHDFCCFFCPAFRFPEDGRIALRRKDGIGGVLQHPDLVACSDCQCAAAAALAHQNAQGGHFQTRHGHDRLGNGIALSPFLGVNAAESTGGVDEGNDRPSEFFRLLHQADSLAVALGLGHTEIPVNPLLQGLSPQVCQNRHRLVVQQCQSSNQSMVIAEAAVAVEFPEIPEDPLNVVHGGSPVAAADHLHLFPGGFVVMMAQFLAIVIQMMCQRNMASQIVGALAGRMGIQQKMQHILQILSFHNSVCHAMLQLERGCLEPSRKFMTNCLLNHSGSGKTDPGLGLRQDHVCQSGEAGGNAAHGGVCQH